MRIVKKSAAGALTPGEETITVPAGTAVQGPDGTWTVTPGVSTLVVTGTV